MSIILDALRKSDAARPGRSEERLAPGPVARPGPPAWLWALLALATLAVMLLAIRGLLDAKALPQEATTPIEPAAAATVRPLADIARETRPEPPPAAARQAADGRNQATASPAPPAVVVRDSLAAPWLDSLSSEFREALPALDINALAWAPAPEDRFVLVNFRRYAEGEQLREGPTLLRIEQGSIVLEYRGQRFAIASP
ncbi:MAG: general secretion pathway protein GspB [Gammaproteobacteria bacterium]|nr:general secretion pathway protein GspB [Gammaproteobacteria bacterium]